MADESDSAEHGVESAQPLRVGVIGAGANTRSKHLPAFRELPGVAVVAVANRTVESSKRIAAEFDIPRVVGDWRELVADPEVDAVVVGTWPHLHAEITIAALEAGKHVLTEARMATSLEEAERMLDASRAHPDRVAQVVPGPMSLAFDQLIVKLLRDGVLGRIREVFAINTGDSAASSHAPLTSRLDRRTSGINILTMGIYIECLQRWLPDDPSIVAAHGAIFTHQRLDGNGDLTEVTIPESVTALGRWEDEARLVLHFSGVERGAPRNEFRINGENASLRLDVATQELLLAEAGKQEVRLEVPEELRGGWRVEREFVASIARGVPVDLTTFSEGVRYMRTTDEIARALAATAERPRELAGYSD